MLEDNEDFFLDVAEKVITEWIIRDFDKTFPQKNKKKRVRRIFKKDLWKSSWGELITCSEVSDPRSYQGRIFKRRFRIPYGLFVDQIVPMCRERNIFGIKDESRVRVPLEFKILICLRILGRGTLLRQ